VSLLGPAVAKPAGPGGVQLPTIGPEVGPGATVPAESAQPTLARAGGAAGPDPVGLRQAFLPVAAVNGKQEK
jgi:hypothetical protein